MNINIEFNDGGITEALNRLLAIGQDLNPVLNALGRTIEEKVRLGFATSTDPYGRPWAPLKVRQGKPLVDKGQLLGSVSYQVDGNSVEIGTNMPYAPTHQYGATIEATSAKALRFFVEGKPVFVGRGHKITIPPREMFPTEGLPADWETDSMDAIAEVLRASLKA
jgi:phage gpG-like protein